MQRTKLFVFVGKDNKCECTEKKANKRLIESMVLSQKEFEKRMRTAHSDLDIEGLYAGRKSIMNCTCNTCGYKWQTEAGNLLDGKGCHNYTRHPGYRHPRRKTHEQFIKDLQSLHPELEVIGTYINAHTELEVRCRECGSFRRTTPHNLLKKSRHGCLNYRDHADYRSSQNNNTDNQNASSSVETERSQ